MKLQNVKLSGIEISDLFFEYCSNPLNLVLSIEILSVRFLEMLPSLKLQGYDEKMLNEDFLKRL